MSGFDGAAFDRWLTTDSLADALEADAERFAAAWEEWAEANGVPVEGTLSDDPDVRQIAYQWEDLIMNVDEYHERLANDEIDRALAAEQKEHPA